MANYHQIIEAFKQLGYHEDSQLSEAELTRALDALANQNMKVPQYDRNVSQEIWEETKKQSSSTVILSNYVQTMLKALNILENNIERTQKQIQRTDNQNQRENLKRDQTSFLEDHRYLTLPFGIKPIKNNRNSSILSGRGSISNSTVIFSKDASNSSSSGTDLKVAFVLSLILLLIELILMFHKHHFYSLLAILAVLTIFFLNYFDYIYIKFVLINLGISCVLDLIWMIVLANHYWYIKPQTQHSTLHSGFLKFIVIMVPILLILKLVLVAILFKYRSNPASIRRRMDIGSLSFNLDGNPANNQLTGVVEGRQEHNFIQ